MTAATAVRPRLLAAGAAVALALTLGGCGGSGATHTHGQPQVVTVERVARHADPRRPVGVHDYPDARGAGATKLQAALAKDLTGMGSQTGSLVISLGPRLRDDRTLYASNADIGRAPASVEKLYTSIAMLKLLGPNARLPTSLLGSGHLGPGGVWHGNLFLQGGGDPTFGDGNWNKVDEDGQGPTAAELAGQLRARGIRRVTGQLYADASLFDGDVGGPATNNAADVPDYGGQLSALVYDHGMTAKGLGPAQFAARQVAATMKTAGITVKAATVTRRTPAAASPLARVYSPPVATMLGLMDKPSDDLFADLFAKQLGARVKGQGTLTAGAAVISSLVRRDYGLTPTIYDGSGLDKADRSSPAQVVALLRELYGAPDGHLLWNGLPVVGRDGTVQTIGLKTPAAGNCVAKTGTLDNVTNLAGYCNARGGHTVAFALFIDGPSNWPALVALSKAVGSIAAY